MVEVVADQQQGDGVLDLVGPQHAVLVEGVAGLVEQAGVGGWGRRWCRSTTEGGWDVLGVVSDAAKLFCPPMWYRAPRADGLSLDQAVFFLVVKRRSVLDNRENTLHSKHKRRGLLAAALVLTASGVVAGSNASANLPGSTFEGGDGNFVVNTAGNTDWAALNAAQTAAFSKGVDLPSGQTDNSFGNGTKTSDVNVTVGLGSIPGQQGRSGQLLHHVGDPGQRRCDDVPGCHPGHHLGHRQPRHRGQPGSAARPDDSGSQGAHRGRWTICSSATTSRVGHSGPR